VVREVEEMAVGLVPPMAAPAAVRGASVPLGVTPVAAGAPAVAGPSAPAGSAPAEELRQSEDEEEAPQSEDEEEPRQSEEEPLAEAAVTAAVARRRARSSASTSWEARASVLPAPPRWISPRWLA
jgi:hypothetical protein